VRSAATKLLIAMEELYPRNVESKKSAKNFRIWASEDIYGPGSESIDLKRLPLDVTVRLLRDVLIPALEECVLDKRHIEGVLHNSLNSPHSSKSPNKFDSGRLTQTSRALVFAFLASHTVHTPLLSVRLRLLTSLNQIRSVAHTSRTKFLLPVLQRWASATTQEAQGQCQEEHVEHGEVDEQAVATVTSNDKDGLQVLNCIITGEMAVDRDGLINAVFERLRSMWPTLKGELRL